jgi:hypothetical protein
MPSVKVQIEEVYNRLRFEESVFEINDTIHINEFFENSIKPFIQCHIKNPNSLLGFSLTNISLLTLDEKNNLHVPQNGLKAYHTPLNINLTHIIKYSSENKNLSIDFPAHTYIFDKNTILSFAISTDAVQKELSKSIQTDGLAGLNNLLRCRVPDNNDNNENDNDIVKIEIDDDIFQNDNKKNLSNRISLIDSENRQEFIV